MSGSRRHPEDLRVAFTAVNGARLYTALSVPVGARPEKAVILCPSLVHEYDHAHRALRQLALALCAAGIPCLRFDYRGQGNSEGAGDVDVAQYAHDVIGLAAWLEGQVKVSGIRVLGLRFGALVARAVAARSDHRAIAWHPVTDGNALLATWQDDHEAGTAGFGREAGVYAESILGWRLTAASQAALRGERLDGAAFCRIYATADERHALSGELPPFVETPDTARWYRTSDEGLVPTRTIALIASDLATEAV